MNRATALVLSGEGRYADPWHPFSATSSALARVLTEHGLDVEVSGDVEERLADLDGVDLLVVNTGDPWHDGPQAPRALPAARAGLSAFARRGGGVLGVHTAAASLRDVPEWRSLLGGVWVNGVSMHPEIGATVVRVTQRSHPVTRGIREIPTFDERYSFLETDAGLDVLAVHAHAGIEHPLVWARQDETGARIVYSALGHDERGYASPVVHRLIAQAADWLLRGRAPGTT